MGNEKLIEVIRLSYLAGIDDTENNVEQWCPKGSKERALDLINEFVDEDLIDGQ